MARSDVHRAWLSEVYLAYAANGVRVTRCAGPDRRSLRNASGFRAVRSGGEGRESLMFSTRSSNGVPERDPNERSTGANVALMGDALPRAAAPVSSS